MLDPTINLISETHILKGKGKKKNSGADAIVILDFKPITIKKKKINKHTHTKYKNFLDSKVRMS